MESRRSGVIVIQSETCEKREKIIMAIQQKMSKQYQVKISGQNAFNMEKLRKQNHKLATANIKYFGKYETRSGNSTMFNVKLKIASEIYGKIMKDGKLNFG